MTGTPRTDAQYDETDSFEYRPHYHWVKAEFARDLERELAALKDELAAMTKRAVAAEAALEAVKLRLPGRRIKK